MEDGLELLKKDWKKKTSDLPSYSEVDLYKMIHKRSTSIVKWIVCVSVLELLFWIGMSVYMKNSDFSNAYQALDKFYFMTIAETISYGVIVTFIYLFYKNYRKINTSSSVKELIQQIITTRKTVQNYVKIVIVLTAITAFVTFGLLMQVDENMITLVQQAESDGNTTLFYFILFIAVSIYIGLMILLIWGFYRIIYGIFLKRLYKNYEELKNIEA